MPRAILRLGSREPQPPPRLEGTEPPAAIEPDSLLRRPSRLNEWAGRFSLRGAEWQLRLIGYHLAVASTRTRAQSGWRKYRPHGALPLHHQIARSLTNTVALSPLAGDQVPRGAGSRMVEMVVDHQVVAGCRHGEFDEATLARHHVQCLGSRIG